MTEKGDSHSRKACPHGEEVVDYLRGELTFARRDAFEAHLQGCDTCRAEIDEIRHVLSKLADAPRPVASRDLTPVILSQIETSHPAWAWGRLSASTWAAAAALLVLLAGATYWFASNLGNHARQIAAVKPEVSAAGDAAAWLCGTQEADGSWSTARWGGNKQFEVALTALSLLALLHEGRPDAADKRMPAAQKAIGYLLEQQNDRGEFGPAFAGSPYNQGLATLALLRAWQCLEERRLKAPLDRAIEVIRSRQNGNGGWGYLNEAPSTSNLSIALWQIEALRSAAALGWNSAKPSVERGLRWVAGLADDEGSFGYRQPGDFPSGRQTLAAMGAMSVLDDAHVQLLSRGQRQAVRRKVKQLASDSKSDMDYYGRYFLAAALKTMGEDSSSQNLSAVRRELLAQQVRGGPDSGSWAGNDRWGSTGGRVYATAMASLSL